MEAAAAAAERGVTANRVGDKAAEFAAAADDFASMAAQLSSAQETSAFGSFASGGGNEAAAGEWADFGSGGDDFGDAYVPFLPPPPSRS